MIINNYRLDFSYDFSSILIDNRNYFDRIILLPYFYLISLLLKQQKIDLTIKVSNYQTLKRYYFFCSFNFKMKYNSNFLFIYYFSFCCCCRCCCYYYYYYYDLLLSLYFYCYIVGRWIKHMQ
jgi:hypothetical protein